MPQQKTKFYVFEFAPESAILAEGLTLKQIITAATVAEPRKKITNDFPDGKYLILADTTGVITKTTETISKTRVEFEAPLKRPRGQKPPAGNVPEPAATKKEPAAATSARRQ
jgi:hypothetical protein